MLTLDFMVECILQLATAAHTSLCAPAGKYHSLFCVHSRMHTIAIKKSGTIPLGSINHYSQCAFTAEVIVLLRK